METTHRIVTGDSRSLSGLEDDSVELVVTSPPYPMIEMWDDLFADLDPAIGERLEAGDGRGAFERMHAELGEVWAELKRVLVEGGIACVNVGDATRTVDGSFRVYQNHSRIVDAFASLGFEPLPEILWRKPANSGAKFMGSGMVPPNAYVTLEHEYLLVFRNGGDSRSFEPGAERRYRAAYFWEERNRLFSDVWTDVNGDPQSIGTGDPDGDLRERSGAYPFEIPYRLITMYTVYGDTVLDPFWGTGTSSLAAMVAGRNSVGYELNPAFRRLFEARLDGLPEYSRRVARKRLADHEAFVAARREEGESFEYEADYYDVPVTTKQERSLRLYAISELRHSGDGYTAVHEPVDTGGETDALESTADLPSLSAP